METPGQASVPPPRTPSPRPAAPVDEPSQAAAAPVRKIAEWEEPEALLELFHQIDELLSRQTLEIDLLFAGIRVVAGRVPGAGAAVKGGMTTEAQPRERHPTLPRAARDPPSPADVYRNRCAPCSFLPK